LAVKIFSFNLFDYFLKIVEIANNYEKSQISNPLVTFLKALQTT